MFEYGTGFYVMHDSEKNGCIQVPYEDLKKWNMKGYGCFCTVHSFNGERRAENLTRINGWLADVDGDGSPETKKRQLNIIRFAPPIPPSVIIETRHGYHCFWKLKGNADVSNYRRIQEGIIRSINADPACKDVARMLRVPGFWHLKNPGDPFMVHTVEDNIYRWSQEQMMIFAKEEKSVKSYNSPLPAEVLFNPDNWDRILRLKDVQPGNRNSELARIALWFRDELEKKGCNPDSLWQLMYEVNQRTIDPLPETELNLLIKSKIKK